MTTQPPSGHPASDDYPRDESADLSFQRIAANALDDLLRIDPAEATALGDHRFDHVLPDRSAAGLTDARDAGAARRRNLAGRR